MVQTVLWIFPKKWMKFNLRKVNKKVVFSLFFRKLSISHLKYNNYFKDSGHISILTNLEQKIVQFCSLETSQNRGQSYSLARKIFLLPFFLCISLTVTSKLLSSALELFFFLLYNNTLIYWLISFKLYIYSVAPHYENGFVYFPSRKFCHAESCN